MLLNTLRIKGVFPVIKTVIKATYPTQINFRPPSAKRFLNNSKKNTQPNSFFHFNGNHMRLEINSIHNRFLSFAHLCYLYIESVRRISIHS